MDVPTMTAALVAPVASSLDGFMTVVFAVVLASGYVALWVIWRLFFRGRGDDPPDPRPEEDARPRARGDTR